MNKILKLLMIAFATTFSLSLTSAQNSTVRYITTDDNVRLFTKEAGTGPICIFIHGGPGAWSKSFEALGGSNLESQLTMIYYDQRGCGRSEDAKNDDYSLDRILRDIEQIRIMYKAKEVYLLAHSFGGVIATNYALKYPGNVKGIILTNCTLDVKYSIRNQVVYINSLLGTDYEISDDNFLQDFIKIKSKLSNKGIGYKLLSDSKKNVELVDSVDRESPSQFTFAKKVFGIKDFLRDYTMVAGDINIPTLIITGRKDHAIGENHYKAFNFPNKEIKIIDGGHLLYFENNKEFVRSIFNFIHEN